MAAILLDEHRGRFRSEEDFEFFVALFEGAVGNADPTTLWAKKRHLATLLSPANATSLVQDRLLQRLLDNPDLLDEIADRVANDDIVD